MGELGGNGGKWGEIGEGGAGENMGAMVNMEKLKRWGGGGGAMETSEKVMMPFPPIFPHVSQFSPIFPYGQAGKMGIDRPFHDIPQQKVHFWVLGPRISNLSIKNPPKKTIFPISPLSS